MRALLALLILAVSLPASAQVHVKGYTRKDGTYVPPHERTAPNSTRLDNYSTKGNYNPYTGKEGTKSPYPERSFPAYTPFSQPTVPRYLPKYQPHNPSYELSPPLLDDADSTDDTGNDQDEADGADDR